MQYRDNLKLMMKQIALAAGLAVMLSGAARATPQDDLRNAVEYNRPALVQKLVAQGIDPNLTTHDGTPLLVDALKDKNIDVAEALIRAKNLDFERRHKAVIDRFGRFPHRNALLGRASTAEEIAFLKEPGSSF